MDGREGKHRINLGMVSDYSEDRLIEKPAIVLFTRLGWKTAKCFHEFEQTGGSALGRETKTEVVLTSRLRWSGSIPTCLPRRSLLSSRS